MNTDEAVVLVKQRNQRGLEFLYDNYASTLKGLVVRIVGSEELGEEVIQETFMKIWSKIELYDASKSRIFTWMASIARNTAIDQKRLRKFKNSEQTDSFNIKYHNTSTEDDYSGMDVKKLMKDLDPKYKEVLDCIYLHGYSHSEASKLLDIPEGTIKTRLSKSIKLLREAIKDEVVLFSSWAFVIFILLKMLWN